MKRKKKKFLYNTEIHGTGLAAEWSSSRIVAQDANGEGGGGGVRVNGLRAIEDRL